MKHPEICILSFLERSKEIIKRESPLLQRKGNVTHTDAPRETRGNMIISANADVGHDNKQTPAWADEGHQRSDLLKAWSMIAPRPIPRYMSREDQSRKFTLKGLSFYH